MWAAVYAVSQTLIALACTWAILTPRVKDGTGIKIALASMLFASIGCIAWAVHWPQEVQRPGAIFSAAVAAMALRCYWIKACQPRIRKMRRKNR